MNHTAAAARTTANPRPLKAALAPWLLACGAVGLVPAGLLAQAPPVARPATVPAKPPIPRGQPATVAGMSARPTIVAADQRVIDTFVNAETAAIAAAVANDDPAVITSVRNALERAAVAMPGKPNSASPAYQQAYAAALNTALLAQLKNPDARVRLAAAVALGRAAASMSQGGLAPAVIQAMQDKTEPVVTWGVKAAADVYPHLLDAAQGQAQATAVANAVIAAVRANPTSPAIAEDAVNALAGTAITGSQTRTPRATAAIVNLLQARAHLYARVAEGTLPEDDPSFPALPGLDNTMATALVNATTWATLPADRKAAAVRAMYDVTKELVRIAPLVPRRGAGEETQTRRENLTEVLKRMAGAIEVAAGSATPAGVAARAMQPLATNEPDQQALTTSLTALEGALGGAKLLGPAVPPPAATNVNSPSPTAVAPPVPATAPAVAAGPGPATRPGGGGGAAKAAPARPGTPAPTAAPTPAPGTGAAPAPKAAGNGNRPAAPGAAPATRPAAKK